MDTQRVSELMVGDEVKATYRKAILPVSVRGEVVALTGGTSVLLMDLDRPGLSWTVEEGDCELTLSIADQIAKAEGR